MGESKLEEILKKEKPGVDKPPIDQPDLKTTLERELEGEDSELAKELQRTRAEEIIARRRMAIERMRVGQASQDTGRKQTQERGKEWLTDVAQGLLERGLDPSVVGRTIDYLLGNAQSPMIGLPGANAPAQGMTFTDMKEIFKMGQEGNRTDPAITSILSACRFLSFTTSMGSPAAGFGSRIMGFPDSISWMLPSAFTST